MPTTATGARKRPRPVVHYLILLSLAVAVPLVGLAFYFIHRVAVSERDATRTALLSSARALAAVVDQEIEKHIAVASALAQADSLRSGDWPEFQRRAKASLLYLPASGLAIVDPTGQVLLDTSVTPDVALPRRSLIAAERQALATNKPQVSDVAENGAASHNAATAMAVIPVIQDGPTTYLLDVVLNPDRFDAILREQHYTSDWLTGIVDRTGNFIARFPEEGTPIGAPASKGWRDAMRQRPEGITEHASLLGYRIIDAYAPSKYGWTVGVAIRESLLEAPLRRTQLMLLAAGLCCIGIGIVLAWLVAHRLHGSAALLRGAADDLASGRPVDARQTGVREYDEAVTALATASLALRARAAERDRAEQALRAREAELEAVINQTPFMLTRCSRDLHYRFVSKGCEALLGCKPEEAVGKPMVDVIGEEAFQRIYPVLERVLNGECVETESEIPYKGTGIRFIHSVSMPETNEHGDVIGWVASMLDITDQKHAEQERLRAEMALTKSADEQAALYEFTNRLYRAESLAVVYEGALDAILRALHCSRAAILRRDERGVMRFIAWRGLSDRYRHAAEGHSPWPEGNRDADPVCIDNVAAAGLPDSLKASLTEEGVAALSFIPLMSSNGAISGMFTACYETPRSFAREEIDLALNLARRLGFASERMQSEQARQLAEQELRKLKEKLETEVEERTLERDRIWNVSEDLLGVSNFEGYLISINPAWSKLLGWTEDEIKSMHASDLRHPEDAAAAIAGRAQLAGGATTIRMENRLRHKDGSWRWIHWTMTSENGLIYLSGRDVTLEKEAAATLEQAQRRSAHSQKMEALGQLTGGVAHDFNNLLMIVSGHAQSLTRKVSDPKDLRRLEAIQIAATRGESLTRQLLAFARGMPLNPAVISPSETITAIRDVLAGSLNATVALSIDVAQANWPVWVDKSEFELALVNLTVNARDAMPDGGRLTISAQNVCLTAPDVADGLTGDFVAIAVTDTGAGIPGDVLSRVFEPFFTTKGADKGTGLGLSQVYGFSRRSGGTAVIKSELGRGTTVTLYLPRSHARIEMPRHEDAVPNAAPPGASVLVVEDNEDVRTVAVSLLEQLGYQTMAVESAAAALQVLAARRPVSVVFSDVVLPGEIDGLSLARTLKSRHPEIPVVLTTGYTNVFDTDPEFPVLRKPYQIAALGRIIREALDSPQTRKAVLAG
jgi:PAS domain S-box-containing protein